MDFTVHSQLTGNMLSAEVTMPDANQFTQYAYYLYYQGAVIQKQMYISNPKFSFPLSQPGKYYIKAFVRTKSSRAEEYIKQSKSTDIFRYYSQEARAEYRAFMDTPLDFKLKPLPYQPYEHPYQDLFLVYDTSAQSKQVQKTLRDMAQPLGLQPTSLSDQALLLTREAVYREGGASVAFSGMGRTNSRLIYGMPDIDSLSCAQALSEQVGSFSLLRADQSQIVFETDYYGTDKLYYLRHDSTFLISNRVHLLILSMQALNIPRLPNMAHIYAYFPNTFYTQQNFSQTLNVQGLIALRSDSRIRIDLHSGEISVEKTPLYHELCSNLPYEESQYEMLIDKACGEIVDNLRIALEHPAFEQYVVHLTGGLDSRLVFSAVTKLPQYKNQILVHTSASSLHDPDLVCALKILSKVPYHFGFPPRGSSRKITYTDAHYRALSIPLGVTGEHTNVSISFPYDKTCIFPGSYGDYLCRPYASKLLRNHPIGRSTVSDAEFWSYVIGRYTPSTVIDVYDALNDTFVKECLTLPGATNLDKLDNHYLFYRNGLHFSYGNRFYAIAPFWGALQAKSLLKLKIMTSSLNWGIKVQLDLIRRLNPEIASVEFASASYEAERAELNRRFGGYPVCKEYDEAVMAGIAKNWKENIEQQKSMVDPDFPRQENPYDAATALSVFHVLAHKLSFPDEVACPIYHYMKQNSQLPENREYNYFLRKLYSLYYELL